MATIKKNVFTGNQVIFKNKQGKIKYWVDIQPSQIEIKIHSNEDIGGGEIKDVLILWDIIKISELQKQPGFVDQTLWSRIGTPNVSAQQLEAASSVGDYYTYFPVELNGAELLDMFGESISVKPFSLKNTSALYNIFAADTNDFTTCTVRLVIDSKHDAGFEVEGPSASSFVDENINVRGLLAPITLSSAQSTIAANSSISITVNSETYIDEVYLESVCGILNKTRVKLTNGVGKFSILTTDLEVGDEVRVKAGHRKWTSLATFSKKIS